MSIADELGLVSPVPVLPGNQLPRPMTVRNAVPKTTNVESLGAVKDMAALLKTERAPVNYLIPGLIPEGLMFLVAPPKVGKSTLILQIAVCLAAGRPFWGIDVPPKGVLIIDLETNERRLRRKVEDAGVTELEAGMLFYATSWPRGLAGVDKINEHLDRHPEIKLVVIDTLQRFRDATSGKLNAYAADYEAIAPLQQLCRDRPGLTIVCVHHTRKATGDDPIDSINGSTAIAGAADTIWIMTRKGSEYFLYVQARDWEREQNDFRIERVDGKWNLSERPRFSESEAEVLKYLEIPGGMKTSQLVDALKITRQSAHERLKRMKNMGYVRRDGDYWLPAV